VKKTHPESAVKIYLRIIAEHIVKRNRKDYILAARYAKKVKDILVNILKDKQRWEDYVNNLS